MQSPASVRAAYDSFAADYARLLPDTSKEHALDLAMLEAFVAAVDEATVDGAPRRILDAGCGAGRITRWLADRGVEVEGVDLSPGMVEQARLAHPDLTFGVGSLLDLPCEDEAFGGVLLWYSTIHLSDAELERALGEAVRVASPTAYLLIGSQSGEGEVDLHDVYARFGHDVALTRTRRTADALAAALDRAGADEIARLVRRDERGDEAMVLARCR